MQVASLSMWGYELWIVVIDGFLNLETFKLEVFEDAPQVSTVAILFLADKNSIVSHLYFGSL